MNGEAVHWISQGLRFMFKHASIGPLSKSMLPGNGAKNLYFFRSKKWTFYRKYTGHKVVIKTQSMSIDPTKNSAKVNTRY